jgi:glycolate oxidase iron-sulfur subunit
MRHNIPVEHFGVQGVAMATTVENCVHCGLCLPACPTYQLLGQEMDSPRGRIMLMKTALEGSLSVEEVRPFVDKCLGCLSCDAICPSDTHYGELLLSFRAYTEEKGVRGKLPEFLLRSLAVETMSHPARFRIAALLGTLVRPLRALLPDRLGYMLDLLPPMMPTPTRFPEIIPAEGESRARVILLTGCVQSVLSPEINRAAVNVLARNGVEVLVPPGQGCCGALAMHVGNARKARALARKNIRLLTADVDAIITTAAGCGSGISDYKLLFGDAPDCHLAAEFAAKVRDVHVFLDDLGLRAQFGKTQSQLLTYHDACHLANAQGIKQAPRRLLKQIPGLELVQLDEVEMCCGSAGLYNIEQPELADQLGSRKAAVVLKSGAAGLVSGNIGCITQIGAHLRSLGNDMPVLHTMEVLDRAYNS